MAPEVSTLRFVQEASNTWRHNNFDPATITPELQLLGAVEEIGELSHAILKNKQGIRGFDNLDDFIEAVADALGDTLIFLCGVASELGLDLDAVLAHTWAGVAQRNWKENTHDGT